MSLLEHSNSANRGNSYEILCDLMESFIIINQLCFHVFDFKTACTVYSNAIFDRILGGEPAESGEFPWMVYFVILRLNIHFDFNFIHLFLKAALGYLNQEYKISFDCGGTVISDYFVLTAAHCVKDARRPVVVRLGRVSA